MISRASTMSRTSQILIIESNHELRALMKNSFSRKGYEVRTCDSGSEFLHRARLQANRLRFSQVDLVVCDIRMLDGDVVKSLLRLGENNKPVPIVLIDQSKEGKAQTIVGELRAAAVINEPTNVGDLLATVRRIIPLVKPSDIDSEGSGPRS